MTTPDAKTGTNQWYVMRVTYQRELIAKTTLDELGVKCFVPTVVVKKQTSSGRVIKKRVAALHNFIFIYSSKEEIDEIKQTKITWLRYVIHHKDSIRRIMVVPEPQMLHFIAIAGNSEERITYLNPDEIDLKRGDRVRIIGGAFEGVEGTFIKVNNKRGKCVVVKIEGIAAVATANIPNVLVEKI